MPFDPHLAAIRFGAGLGPGYALPRSAADILADLAGADEMAVTLPIPTLDTMQPDILTYRDAARARGQATNAAQRQAARDRLAELRNQANATYRVNLLSTLARAATAPVGFRERLVAFWANHLTVRARNGQQMHMVTPYVEQAIRPFVGTSFPHMLHAVATNPMMLQYLQQARSTGPNGAVGKRTGRGLNENYARELLELHTLGVDGPYDQDDVRQLAELLAGLTFDPDRGVRYEIQRTEPGAETVLGKNYGDHASMAAVDQVLLDLALHPATAMHICRKIAAHFIADVPDPALVTAMAATYSAANGDLIPVYETMLNHASAWDATLHKVKRPLAFMASSLRALGVDAAAILAIEGRDFRRYLDMSLRVMGQPWERPAGPDGWPDTPADWIFPQTMAGRITWAMTAPETILDDLPDPRDFVVAALGPFAADEVIFAARAAESRPEGIGIILSSAVFQRT